MRCDGDIWWCDAQCGDRACAESSCCWCLLVVKGCTPQSKALGSEVSHGGNACQQRPHLQPRSVDAPPKQDSQQLEETQLKLTLGVFVWAAGGNRGEN